MSDAADSFNVDSSDGSVKRSRVFSNHSRIELRVMLPLLGIALIGVNDARAGLDLEALQAPWKE